MGILIHNSLWSSINFIPLGSSKNTSIKLRSVYHDISFDILTLKGLSIYSKNTFNSTLDLAFESGIINDIINVNLQLSFDHFPIF